MMRDRSGRLALLAPGLALVTVAPSVVAAQTAADSVAVMDQILENWTDSASLEPYFGDPPRKPYHHLGEPTSFCVVFAPGTGVGPDPSDRGLSRGQVARIVEVVTAQFALDHLDECRLRRTEAGRVSAFLDEEGRPAIAVTASTVFDSADTVWATLGMSSGSWPGMRGWRCELVRRGGAWIRRGGCFYWET